MADQELTPEEATAEGLAAEGQEVEAIPTAEEPTGTEQEMAAAGGFDATPEQIPELSGKAIGDTVTLAIRGISDDGNTYTLAVVGEEGSPVTPGPGAGREAIAAELTGGGGV